DHGKAEAATTTTKIDLDGSVVEGDVLTIDLAVGADTAVYTYTVTNDPLATLATIARALVDAINNDDQNAFIADNQFIALVNGASLVIVARSGVAFATTLTGPAGEPTVITATSVPVSAVDADALPLSNAGLADSFIFLAIDTQNFHDGGDDLIYGEDGEDIILGQQGDDRIYGGNDDDDLIGGHNVRSGHDGDDRIDGSDFGTVVEAGETDNDVIVGDNGFVLRRGDVMTDRARVLDGTLIYNMDDIVQVTDAPQDNPQMVNGSLIESRDVHLFDHSFAPLPDTYGDDYIAGGPDDDVLFGQLGDDVIQGDGEVALNADVELDVNARRVFTYTARSTFAGEDTFEYTYIAVDPVTGSLEIRTATVTILTPALAASFVPAQLHDDVLVISSDGAGGYYPIYFTAKDLQANDLGAVGGIESITLHPDPATGYALGTLVTELLVVESNEKLTDGDDYIEGGGDQDIIFGNLGQDDIIGGNSDLFGLNDRLLRPDGNDLIFGGAGTDIARNDLGQAALVTGEIITEPNGHSLDADMILGDNGNIFRLVGTNGIAVGAFLTFNYDSYGPLKIIPRAAELLDYTVGGPDYLPTAAQSEDDIGAGDEIHGESGDDFIYGMAGSDILFGEGQDDDIIGGYGFDWISGGTGQDGVLGDDGRIYTSRNSKDYGEPLYGIAVIPAGELNLSISTPGKIQRATINIGGVLKKTVNLTPFKLGDPDDLDYAHDMFDPSYADDIIYGGWGSDFIHAGDGDDAVSGAEALAVYYEDPANPGNVLRFGEEKAGEFTAYDEYDPWRRIMVDDNGVFTTEADPDASEFLLNFDHEDVDGPGLMPLDIYGPDYGFERVMTDGDDVIFGDLGNDWLVGGTGRDQLYGGYGSDLLNVDDNHDSTIDTGDPRANDIPDTHPSYEDLTYGGAGRDVLIGNTGGDRLIDWAGEFNSYIVPFAPFGLATVSRALQPRLKEFLYDLSASYGADPTRAADTGADPIRNGEPEGELGMVTQKDFDWKGQTGAPDDPQVGNVGGGKRDVLRSATFNTGNTEGFFTDSGIWDVQGGALQVSAGSLGGDAVSVYHVDEMLPSYFEIQATITMKKPIAGWKANSYVIFDYYSATDFKFAGLNASIDKIQMGHRDETGWHVDVQTNMRIKPGRLYNILVAVNGTNVTVIGNNTEVFSHTFDARIIEGYAYAINAGMIGFGSDSSRGVYDNIAVQVLPPEITLEATEEFPDTDAAVDFVPESGLWQNSGGRYDGTPGAGGDIAVSLVDLGIDRGLDVNSLLKIEVTLSTQDTAGVVFDSYGAGDFKFAIISAENNQLIIGHHTKRKGFVYDAVFDTVIEAGTDYVLNVSLKGTTVSASVKEAGSEYWQAIDGYVFNAVTVDGDFGLLAKAGTASFDSVTVRTDDPAFREDQGQALMASVAPEVAVGAESILTYEALAPIIETAIDRWSESQFVDENMLALLDQVSFEVADLSGLTLARATGTTVLIDIDAAGYGWFIDTTPYEDSEFDEYLGTLQAAPSSPASGAMDLLTVVMHELGHILGFEDIGSEQNSHDPMNATLDAGVRRLNTEASKMIPLLADDQIADSYSLNNLLKKEDFRIVKKERQQIL
ncbi:MAG: calcium-binding protein, partial [Planctomycetota bacterium]